MLPDGSLITVVRRADVPHDRAYLVSRGWAFAEIWWDDLPHRCGDGVEGWTLTIVGDDREWDLLGQTVLEAAEYAIDSLAEGLMA